jgi:hypothetical protein
MNAVESQQAAHPHRRSHYGGRPVPTWDLTIQKAPPDRALNIPATTLRDQFQSRRLFSIMSENRN